MKGIDSPYITVYSRYYSLGYDEVETIQEGIDLLESGSNTGLWFPIAVVEVSTKKMVWDKDFFLTTKEENQRLADKLLLQLEGTE